MSESVKPITPSEVRARKAEAMPVAVIEAFNKLIAANWDGSKATVLQRDAIAEIEKADINGDGVFLMEWLNIEEVYRHAGWKVEYDKPGFNESYPASFTFSRGRRSSPTPNPPEAKP